MVRAIFWPNLRKGQPNQNRRVRAPSWLPYIRAGWSWPRTNKLRNVLIFLKNMAWPVKSNRLQNPFLPAGMDHNQPLGAWARDEEWQGWREYPSARWLTGTYVIRLILVLSRNGRLALRRHLWSPGQAARTHYKVKNLMGAAMGRSAAWKIKSSYREEA